jgi:hypothetical protein
MYKSMIILGITTVLSLVSCQSDSPLYQYKQWEKEELASGERHDSLFLGLTLGMTSTAFYDHCWELNRQGKFKDGLGNSAVAYDLDEALPHAATLYFYPRFTEDRRIQYMDMKFTYDGWAPWNRHMFADSLLPQVVNLLEDWFGPSFMRLESERYDAVIYAKIDGNRKITARQGDQQFVEVTIEDMDPEGYSEPESSLTESIQ